MKPERRTAHPPVVCWNRARFAILCFSCNKLCNLWSCYFLHLMAHFCFCTVARLTPQTVAASASCCSFSALLISQHRPCFLRNEHEKSPLKKWQNKLCGMKLSFFFLMSVRHAHPVQTGRNEHACARTLWHHSPSFVPQSRKPGMVAYKKALNKLTIISLELKKSREKQ